MISCWSCTDFLTGFAGAGFFAAGFGTGFAFAGAGFFAAGLAADFGAGFFAAGFAADFFFVLIGFFFLTDC